MKKSIGIILAVIMTAALVACGDSTGNSANKLTGTWEADSVDFEGSIFTIAELEASGDDSMSGLQIVLKDGGKAFVFDGESGDIFDWSEDGNTVTIGVMDCTVKDGCICLELDGGTVFFKKVSDSQTFGEGNREEQNAESEIPAAEEKTPVSPVTIKESPDKYTWYIKNYVGKNCASIGYTSLGGDRMDSYGDGYIELVLIAPDGSYIDPEDEDGLKQYSITGQSIAPNTEIKFTYEIDSDGKESDYWVDSQSFEEIVLSVKKVGEGKTEAIDLTPINPSPDKYTWYVADYTGRNLANCGYTSLGGDLMHAYGAAVVKLVIVSEDGAYIDPEDIETLKNYVVTGQNIAPNTELKLTLSKDSDGGEYNFADTQSIEEIEITVKPIA